ncbi:lactate utilization protein, partial [Aestuariivirga sp.]|uniref:lactate utilization protein n=1 Tax=Aestuariivirga sp. TaxID=2650926 RepID=UPI0035B019B9
MSAREEILGRVRSRLPKAPDEARRAAVELRIAQHPQNLIPARGQGDTEHRIRVFTEMMLAVGGTVEVVDDINEVPHHVAEYLRNGNLPAVVRRGADPVLAKLPWHRGGTLEVTEGPAVDADRASISRAFAGVAESGTIVQVSGADNPTT